MPMIVMICTRTPPGSRSADVVAHPPHAQEHANALRVYVERLLVLSSGTRPPHRLGVCRAAPSGQPTLERGKGWALAALCAQCKATLVGRATAGGGAGRGSDTLDLGYMYV